MDSWRMSVLALLVTAVPATEGVMRINDPSLCYILDGMLLVYGIFITVLYVKVRFVNSKTASRENSDYMTLNKTGDVYNDLGPRNDPESGNTRRDHRAGDLYTPLKMGTSDTYREIGVRKERRRDKTDLVYQGLSSSNKEAAYDTLTMQPLPPRR